MLIGFKCIKIQPLGLEGKPDGEPIVLEGKEGKGATQEATISGLSAEPVKVWGSDTAYYVSQKGTGDVKAALTLLDMPVEGEARILGYTIDEELGAQMIGEETEPPYCAITLESRDATGNAAVMGFFKGKFSKGDVSMKSKEGTSYTPSGDSYTFSVAASDRADKTKGYSMVKFIGPSDKKLEVENLVLRTAAEAAMAGNEKRREDGKSMLKAEK